MTPVSSIRLLVVSGSAPEPIADLAAGGVLEDVRPAPGPGVAAAGAVGEEPDEVGWEPWSPLPSSRSFRCA